MARVAAVTRNVKVVCATVLQFNLESMQVENRDVTIPQPYCNTAEGREKYIQRIYKDVVSHKYLKTLTTRTIEQLYGLKMDDFLRYAVPLTADRKFPDGSDAE